ncbi:hypothetical protein BX616_000155 [Lobosporangium transversale]|nr:hypothetical protein BX616_000155 [Lobosporangium transversale]
MCQEPKMILLAILHLMPQIPSFKAAAVREITGQPSNWNINTRENNMLQPLARTARAPSETFLNAPYFVCRTTHILLGQSSHPIFVVETEDASQCDIRAP